HRPASEYTGAVQNDCQASRTLPGIRLDREPYIQIWLYRWHTLLLYRVPRCRMLESKNARVCHRWRSSRRSRIQSGKLDRKAADTAVVLDVDPAFRCGVVGGFPRADGCHKFIHLHPDEVLRHVNLTQTGGRFQTNGSICRNGDDTLADTARDSGIDSRTSAKVDMGLACSVVGGQVDARTGRHIDIEFACAAVEGHRVVRGKLRQFQVGFACAAVD